jgi:hypothetical protein
LADAGYIEIAGTRAEAARTAIGTLMMLAPPSDYLC